MMGFSVKKIYLLIFVFLPVFAFTQVKEIGIPKVVNHPKSEYNAGTQNWAITQDKNGFMYFANNDGVLKFDGIRWELINVEILSPVRSVMVDDQNRIFVGLINDFGILTTNKNEPPKYHSLRELLPDDFADFEDIWKIHQTSQGIIFQSFDYMFVYNNNEVNFSKPKNQFHFSFNVDGKLYLNEPGLGLFEFIAGKAERVDWANEIKNDEIWSMLKLDENRLLIGTREKGLYLFKDGKLSQWEVPVNEDIVQNNLYCATTVMDNYIAFGTILDGVIISDYNGNVIQHINQNKGLQKNTVLSIFSDKDKNLWLGLDNGIDYVDINSPLSFFSEYPGIGTGYCCCVFENDLYIGTNQGLYSGSFNDYSGEQGGFKLVENTPGQVWSLEIFDGQLLCGHNSGTFIIKNKQAKKISSKEGTWKYLPLNENPDLLLGGYYNGLFLLNKTSNGWEYHKEIKGFNESSRFLFQDKKNNIWISHGAKGIFRITLNSDLDSAVSVKIYNSANGLPSNEQNILLNFNEEVCVSTINGIYCFDDSTNTFVYSKTLNNRINSKERIKTIKTDTDNNIWFIAQDEAGVLRQNEDLTYTKITNPFKELVGNFVNEFEFIYPYNDQNIFMGLDDGFVHYSAEIPKLYTQEFQCFITKLEVTNLDSVLYFYDYNNKNEFEFPFRKNAFRFHYTAPFYGNQGKLTFSYFLENYSESWSDWSPDIYRDFTNLPEGDYEFKVKAKNIYGVESKTATISFTVLPPWFRSGIAYYSYLVIFIVVVWLTVWYILYRMRKATNKAKQKLQLEMQKKDEEFQHQALIAEKEIIELRNEKLRAEKIHRDKELANQTMNIVQKNKFLIRLNEELQRIQNSTDDKVVITKMAVIKKRIKKEIDSQQQEKLFETYFEDVHAEFFKRLKEQFPHLTPNDLKLCAYIRMNVLTKEIAALLNISYRGVEISRYRLRKKLDLSRDVNLSSFLSNI